MLSTAAGAPPLSSQNACVQGPFARRRVCGMVPPGKEHHAQVGHDTYPWGARSWLSINCVGGRLQDPSLVASPLTLAPKGSWRALTA